MPAQQQQETVDHQALIALMGAEQVIKQTGKAGEQGGVRLVVGDVTVAHGHPTASSVRLWVPAVGFNTRGLEVKTLKKGASTVVVRTAADARKVRGILGEVAKSKATAKS